MLLVDWMDRTNCRFWMCVYQSRANAAKGKPFLALHFYFYFLEFVSLSTSYVDVDVDSISSSLCPFLFNFSLFSSSFYIGRCARCTNTHCPSRCYTKITKFYQRKQWMDSVMVIIKAAAASFSVPAYALFYLQKFFEQKEFISVWMHVARAQLLTFTHEYAQCTLQQ